MPFRLLAVLLLLAGCTTQRDAADLETAPDTTAVDSTADPALPDPAATGGPGAPNIAVYLDGTWELTLTPRAGGEPIRGTWTVAEQGENRFAAADLAGPVRVAERSVSGDTFSVIGVVERAEGPAAFEAGGTLRGHEMTGEVTVEGLGTFDLAGTRRLD